jgi:alkylhydroperoxidase family enzyme
MSELEYHDRQKLEMEHWPELRETVNRLINVVFAPQDVSGQLKQEVFVIASQASGCVHCQSHGSFHLNALGVDATRIQALWDFERSPLFSDAERAAYRLALAAGSVPNATEPGHFEELHKHYSDQQIREILAVIAMGGFLNRWNDTVATVTDQESVDFAMRTLTPVGWKVGKHVGEKAEQRPGHPITVGWIKK